MFSSNSIELKSSYAGEVIMGVYFIVNPIAGGGRAKEFIKRLNYSKGKGPSLYHRLYPISQAC